MGRGAGGFDPSIPTAWIAEGVLFYLSSTGVADLLSHAAEASASRSIFAADIFGTGLLRRPAMQPLVASRTKAGIPLPFCSDAPRELFLNRGWSDATLTDAGAVARELGRATDRPGTQGVADANLTASFVIAVKG